jgi:hypothetical protein
VTTTDYREPDVELPLLGMSDELLSAPVVTPPHGGGTSPSITWSARLKQFARPTAYYALSRLAVLFAALAAKWMAPKLNPLKAMTNGWDGYWYRLIEQHGYPTRLINENHGSRWAFFPAWPAVVRGTVEVTGLSYSAATFLLSLLLGLTATIAIWLAVREIFGPVVADRSVLLFVFFPASYVLSWGYTEGLFLTAAAACLYALSRRYWITAALLAGLASLTRSFGVVLIACVVVAAIPVIFKERKLRPLVAVAIAPLGFLAWLAYSWAMVGTPLAFLSAEKFWNNGHFVWFLSPIVATLSVFRSWANGQVVLAAVAVIFAYGGFVLLAKARGRGVSIPMFWWVFTVGSILGMLSPYEPVSVMRYSLAVVPLFAGYAWRMRPSWEGPVVGVLAFSQGVLALIVVLNTLHPHTALIWP